MKELKEKLRKEKEKRAGNCIMGNAPEKVFDVFIRAKSEYKGRTLFSVNRRNIELLELVHIVENLEKTTKNLVLKGRE